MPYVITQLNTANIYICFYTNMDDCNAIYRGVIYREGEEDSVDKATSSL